jgi:hypothetical protein
LKNGIIGIMSNVEENRGKLKTALKEYKKRNDEERKS